MANEKDWVSVFLAEARQLELDHPEIYDDTKDSAYLQGVMAGLWRAADLIGGMSQCP